MGKYFVISHKTNNMLFARLDYCHVKLYSHSSFDILYTSHSTGSGRHDSSINSASHYITHGHLPTKKGSRRRSRAFSAFFFSLICCCFAQPVHADMTARPVAMSPPLSHLPTANQQRWARDADLEPSVRFFFSHM
jgi:hypothetical protein